MNNDPASLYSDARRYDLIFGAYASGKFLKFYHQQIARYGEPVLELACGSGRLTVPLAQAGFNITGLDISEEMLQAGRLKAFKGRVKVRFIQGDIRTFDVGEKFKFIFIPSQSLSHLNSRTEIEECLSCVRKHLAEDGRFLAEIFNPSLKILARDFDRLYCVGEFYDPNQGRRVLITEQMLYETAIQVNQIRWFLRSEGSDEAQVLSFKMRHFFPEEIDALLWYNGFQIERKYGNYDEEEFCNSAPKQLIVCRNRL
ncbi:MAG TPA: class I SAM-dependent methyltransferase [Pyrinomonadaceae bacterium]